MAKSVTLSNASILSYTPNQLPPQSYSAANYTVKKAPRLPAFIKLSNASVIELNTFNQVTKREGQLWPRSPRGK